MSPIEAFSLTLTWEDRLDLKEVVLLAPVDGMYGSADMNADP